MTSFCAFGCVVILLTVLPCTVVCQRCTSTVNISSETGSSATFVFNTTNTRYGYVDFKHGNVMLFEGHIFSGIIIDDNYNKTKYNISVDYEGDEYLSVTIILLNVNDQDNGTYTLGVILTPYTYCLTLYVLKPPTIPDITYHPARQGSDIAEEADPISLTGSQSLSNTIPSPGFNVSMAWLIGVEHVTSRGMYQVTYDSLLILNVDRRQNNRNITYRATEEGGLTSERNFTLKIAYGPDPYLTLQPDKSVYLLTVGNVIPVVYCSAVCFPSCNTYWISGKLLKNTTGPELQLGQATVAMSGDYACVSTRDGTYKTTKRTITLDVKVKDEVDITAIIVLGSLLGMTIVLLTVLSVFVIRNMFGRKGNGTNSASKGSKQTRQGTSNAGVMESYMDLQLESREVPVEVIYDPIETPVSGEIDYVNTGRP